MNLGRDAQDLGFKLLVSWVSQTRHLSAWNLCPFALLEVSFFLSRDFSWKLGKGWFQACILENKELYTDLEKLVRVEANIAGWPENLPASFIREGFCQFYLPAIIFLGRCPPGCSIERYDGSRCWLHRKKSICSLADTTQHVRHIHICVILVDPILPQFPRVCPQRKTVKEKEWQEWNICRMPSKIPLNHPAGNCSLVQ